MMGLRRKPHSVVLESVTEPVQADRSVGKPTYSNVGSFSVQITPLSPVRAYELFGIETTAPHLLLGETSDFAAAKIGDRVTFGSRVFHVKHVRRERVAGQFTNHIALLLDEVQFG